MTATTDLEGQFRPSRSLGWFRAVLIIAWTFWMLLTNLGSVLASRGLPQAVTKRWHRGVARLAGIEISTQGLPVDDHPVLMVSNHISYLDIIVLGALLPCSFVAKEDVAGWPVFGWMAKLQRTVFISRDPRKAASQLEVMKERMAEGGCIILFPEGTSSDGSRVLPFKSSLFQSATIEFQGSGQVYVQPLSIAYTHLDGIPMGRAFRPLFAWYGDMDLAPHLIDFLGYGKIRVEVVFHRPSTLDQAGDRKKLTRYAETCCSSGVEAGNKNRANALPSLNKASES